LDEDGAAVRTFCESRSKSSAAVAAASRSRFTAGVIIECTMVEALLLRGMALLDAALVYG